MFLFSFLLSALTAILPVHPHFHAADSVGGGMTTVPTSADSVGGGMTAAADSVGGGM